ncbi:Acetoacetyl-CoA synthetase [Araneus ventricosus]|uniref:Acetoacetyl-CoA synthetase n=1 Tax=Araneus ventricosus TaxID=182803 RepID=A0A4Y2G2J1_ARAVE|nr:Acetoacetyl-CoA synthetase [Araneus ventricosus]
MAPNVSLQRRKRQPDAKRDIENLRKEFLMQEKQQKKQQEKEQKKQQEKERKKQQNKERSALLAKERCKRYYENKKQKKMAAEAVAANLQLNGGASTSTVDTFPEVRDCLCVSHYGEKMDERAVLFLKIRDGYSFTDELVSKIREAIARELTIRHVPDVILETKDIPYNINGKKMEIIVKKIINNKPYNAETVKNPESLKYFQNVPELNGF